MPEVSAPPSAAPAKTITPSTPSAAPPMESKKPPQEPDGVFDDAFAAINDLDSGKPAPKKEAAKSPPSKAGAKDGLEDGTHTKSEAEDSDVETADTSSNKKESDSEQKNGSKPNGEQKPFKAAELRTAYENLKKKIAEDYEPKVKRLPELEAKLKEFESRDETVGKATQERIQAIEKRNAELEQHIKFVDFEKSKDYQENYQKPYEDAWGAALRELKGLTMTVDDPKTGEPVTREVTPADLSYFANLDPATRRTEINRLFPEDREEVKRHVNTISHLAEKAFTAKEKAKKDAEGFSQTQLEQQRQSMAQRQKLWQATNETLAKKYPKWFGKEEGDDEGNDLLDRGAALADLVFSPSDLTAERIEKLPKVFREAIESKKPFSQEAMVKLHAIARNKIANHDRAIKRLNAAQARIAELEKSLKQYEESSPEDVPAGGKRSITPAGFAEASSELEALDRKFK